MKISKITAQDQSLWHVLGAVALCLVTVSTGVFDTVSTELGSSHYAEKPIPGLPGYLSMPCNSLINLGYIILGTYWLAQDEKAIGVGKQNGRYLKNVFSWMAIVYGPVQWARIWTQTQRAAVLDQWFTLPIFAWAIIWANSILNNWDSQHFMAVEFLSLSSYFLSNIHPQGFELALAIHIIWAFTSGLRLQRKYGDSTTRVHLVLALISCLGFVNLKLLDHWLAQYFVFQRLTGHFWSKICDILQFHYAFCFLAHLEHCRSTKVKK
ncbi:transmembrane protein 187 [Hyla sarda]|uniref:transmembrane protein 187 n=1 Tax=Hyla sarda TaxID=327740 RepID=UPI0024C31EE3|nr:transmembrane protein 187 [Hyla sarda]XP_056395620.1 transmembrane protein 187 [Hyla sarda]XP_056395621.1 transmembrane protein 187 [Hyla sarda]XP_056395622.1 transmembrane protein 187 [Hyla sarda]XP_056395623.1 transmembrane protein 187 [Hyla sarda]XP_056395624.1 transmembrane protein 187 [Hyla sarda]XP_056395625.1 transmembrane protein 187 [Hyla sarda]